MSGSQNRSCCNIIYRLGLNIVMLLTLLLSMLLFAGSFLTTCYADNMETQQVLLRPDNPLWNLLELAGFGLLFCGCLYLYEKIGEKFRRGLLVFTLTFVFGLGILLILFGRTVPAADALSVYNAAAEWILGNTDIIHPTVSYLSYYPQQIGLMAFWSCCSGSGISPACPYRPGTLSSWSMSVCCVGRSGSNICRCNICGRRITRRSLAVISSWYAVTCP